MYLNVSVFGDSYQRSAHKLCASDCPNYKVQTVTMPIHICYTTTLLLLTFEILLRLIFPNVCRIMCTKRQNMSQGLLNPESCDVRDVFPFDFSFGSPLCQAWPPLHTSFCFLSGKSVLPYKTTRILRDSMYLAFLTCVMFLCLLAFLTCVLFLCLH